MDKDSNNTSFLETFQAIIDHRFDNDQGSFFQETSDILSPLFDNAHALTTGMLESCPTSQKNAALDLLLIYGINSEEGRLLLRLSEAMSRIKDSQTANLFITDALSMLAHSNNLTLDKTQGSFFTQIGLKHSTELLQYAKKHPYLQKTINPLLLPLIKQAILYHIKKMGKHFILSSSLNQLNKKIQPYTHKHYVFSIDMLGESARSLHQAQRYYTQYHAAIEQLANINNHQSSLWDQPNLSIKLSALDPQFTLSHLPTLKRRLIPKLLTLIAFAKKQHITITIDAEETDKLELTLLLFEKLKLDPELKAFDGLGIAIQAYQRVASHVIDHLGALAKATNSKIPIRLVKGAYFDQEIKQCQIEALPAYPLFTTKSDTDQHYLACAVKLLNNPTLFYPQFASHNLLQLVWITHYIDTLHEPLDYEIQCLFGMQQTWFDMLSPHHRTRIYAPIGSDQDLLSYFIRRLLENGASNSFLFQSEQDHSISLTNPFHTSTPTPDAILSPPNRKDYYGFLPHANPSLNYYQPFISLLQAVKKSQEDVTLISLLSHQANITKINKKITNPANVDIPIGSYSHILTKDLLQSMENASQSLPNWKNQTIEIRAKLLEECAKQFVNNEKKLLALLIRESGKTFADAMAEIKETIDYCNYYAYLARSHYNEATCLTSITGESNYLQVKGRGVVACISPWNFPLAIFVGQIAAALIMGNTVIAKPASHTPAIAHLAITLMHEAGIPKDVLQLTFASAKQFSSHILSHKDLALVAFTGSHHTAHHIHMTLAKQSSHIIPLIAETGGMNAMVIDHTILPEVTIDDIITSAFNSAGQRCSSLRLLMVPNSMIDTFVPLLIQAMEHLHIGDPSNPDTDIGPIISKDALATLTQHQEWLTTHHQILFQTPLKETLTKKGIYFPPTLAQLASFSDLTEEIFGPILHIVPYPDNAIDFVIDTLNDCPFGLTLGIQTRIEGRANHITNQVNIGNIYINQPMIGATVSMQPFGGMKQSGTGPKAGGPHYLQAFGTESTVTTNLTAIGGNTALL